MLFPVGLSPEQNALLVAAVRRHGSRLEVVRWAMAQPDYRDEFWLICQKRSLSHRRRVEARAAERVARGEGRAHLEMEPLLAADGAKELIPPGQADELAWFWQLVVDALKRDGEPVAITDLNSQVPASMPPLPNQTQINAFTYATLQKAVKSLDDDETLGDVARDARMPRTDVRRVEFMFGKGLFRLNDRRKLTVDGRVARKGKKYVLRYLDADGMRWLDPNVERGR